MGAFEWAAAIGAAAWLPQVITWIAKWFAKPKLKIIPSNTPEVGYTSFGPIFNLTCAIAAERKDAVVERVSVSLRHERGQKSLFIWESLNETFSQIRSTKGFAEISKNQPAIALKVSTLILTEKQIGMRETTFQDEIRPYITALSDHQSFLKKTQADYQQGTIGSKEFADLVELYKRRFTWQEGRYHVTAELRIAGVKEPTKQDFVFSLSAGEIDKLKQNLDEIERYIRDTVQQPLDGDTQYNWNWQYPPFEGAD